MPSPFPLSSSKAGHGSIHLTLLPPSTPSFSTLSYAYPLKLVPSTPHILPPPPPSPPPTHDPTPNGSTNPASSNLPPPPQPPTSVPLLFLLTYGGGLISGDCISLSITLDPRTRLTVTTQGSTKIFKPSITPPPTTHQTLHVHISAHAALWLAPDPVQPFAGSLYQQIQVFELEKHGSVGLVDWVSEGRTARGECWEFNAWRGRNEIWAVDGPDPPPPLPTTPGPEVGKRKKRLLVRDAIVLEGGDVAERMDTAGVFGTVLLRGPLFEPLGRFFVEEFGGMPRIGGRDWGDGDEGVGEPPSRKENWRAERVRREKEDGLLWTSCFVRGCTVVKFTAREVEGARAWLRSMLREEGTVARECGEGGLMFVR